MIPEEMNLLWRNPTSQYSTVIDITTGKITLKTSGDNFTSMELNE